MPWEEREKIRKAGLAELARRKLELYEPYKIQREFHLAGAKFDERLFMAASQVGKTWAAAMEWAMHLTGRYPHWWDGHVVRKPGRFWVAGKSATSTRDTVQKLLVGDPEKEDEWGTGTIPADALGEWFRSGGGVRNALDSVTVKHRTGGKSTLLFKAYEQGWEKWQGDTLDGLWMDEEPPEDIYNEGKTRTQAKAGIVAVTFTPLSGRTKVVESFMAGMNLDELRKLAMARAR